MASLGTATNRRDSDARRLTVARIRLNPQHADVMFFETARIYRLLRVNPVYERSLRVLRLATMPEAAVWVRFDEPNGDVIADVRSID